MVSSSKNGKMNTGRLTQLAMLTGVALIIFTVELQIPNPFPIPGIKLGLANVVTVYALYRYRAREVMMIVFTRILLAAVFSGNMMALVYSFAGSVFCLTGMLLLKHIIDENHIWIASVFGAVLHNTGQMAAAVAVLGRGIMVYLPFLLVSGCLAGAFTGILAQLVAGRMKRAGYFGTVRGQGGKGKQWNRDVRKQGRRLRRYSR